MMGSEAGQLAIWQKRREGKHLLRVLTPEWRHAYKEVSV